MNQRRLALVTGGAGTLGRAFASILSERGYEVCLTDQDARRLDLAIDLLGRPFDLFTELLDVTDAAAWKGLV